MLSNVIIRLLAITVLAALISDGAAKAGDRISAADLQRLVPGATLKGEAAGGGEFEGTYYIDGTMVIRTADDSDTGTWELEDDTVCLTWQKWRDGKRYCIYWEKTSTGYVSRFLDGRLSTTFKLVE